MINEVTYVILTEHDSLWVSSRPRLQNN